MQNKIDYKIWGQHTISEARYNGREMAIHVRIPAQSVMKARGSFEGKDIGEFNPHLDLKKQPYQFHIFNGTRGDAYINNVPFGHVKQLLWYLHKHQEERDGLVATNESIQFKDFKKDHEFSKKPGIVWLYVGHEKYGLFDWTPKDRFSTVQLHRAALYGAFLRSLNYVFKDKDIGDALPDGVKQKVENGVSLGKAVERSIDFRPDGEYTVHSVLESLTLIFDEESPRLKQGNLRVCEEHQPPIYWANYKGRKTYRIIDPKHPGGSDIKRELEKIIKEECPICEEAVLVAP